MGTSVDDTQKTSKMGYNMNHTSRSGRLESLNQSQIAQDALATTSATSNQGKSLLTNHNARAIIFLVSETLTDILLRTLILHLQRHRHYSSATLILMPMVSREDCDKVFKNVQFDKAL
jgi:hypothetical protein